MTDPILQSLIMQLKLTLESFLMYSEGYIRETNGKKLLEIIKKIEEYEISEAPQ